MHACSASELLTIYGGLYSCSMVREGHRALTHYAALKVLRSPRTPSLDLAWTGLDIDGLITFGPFGWEKFAVTCSGDGLTL